MVTPGIALTDQLLDSKGNNFLAAVSFQKDKAGVVFLDISSRVLCWPGDVNYVSKLVMIFPHPKFYIQETKTHFSHNFQSKAYTFRLDDWVFQMILH